jgi:hypothetical protein
MPLGDPGVPVALGGGGGRGTGLAMEVEAHREHGLLAKRHAREVGETGRGKLQPQNEFRLHPLRQTSGAGWSIMEVSWTTEDSCPRKWDRKSRSIRKYKVAQPYAWPSNRPSQSSVSENQRCTTRNRHQRGSASVTGGGSVEGLAPKMSWRSPEGGDTLGCERAPKNPPQQETAARK